MGRKRGRRNQLEGTEGPRRVLAGWPVVYGGLDLGPRPPEAQRPRAEDSGHGGTESQARRGARGTGKKASNVVPRQAKHRRHRPFRDILADYMEYSARTKRSHEDDRPKRIGSSPLYGQPLGRRHHRQGHRGLQGRLRPGARPGPDARSVGARANQPRCEHGAHRRHRQPLPQVRQGRVQSGDSSGPPHVQPQRAVKLYRENNALNRCLSNEEEAPLNGRSS